MSKVDFSLNISLDTSEFIQVGDNIYTTHDSLNRELPSIHFIGEKCLNTLKKFEGQLTQNIIEEWLLLSRALDQTCSFESQWDDLKIIETLIKGEEHPVSWYVHNCTMEAVL
jgi:hypothetical protein